MDIELLNMEKCSFWKEFCFLFARDRSTLWFYPLLMPNRLSQETGTDIPESMSSRSFVVYLGLSPFPVIIANEGLGWNPVLYI